MRAESRSRQSRRGPGASAWLSVAAAGALAGWISVWGAGAFAGCVPVLAAGCSPDEGPTAGSPPAASGPSASKARASGKRGAAEHSARTPVRNDGTDRKHKTGHQAWAAQRPGEKVGPGEGEEVGLGVGEDPFEVSDVVAKHVERLMRKYRPQTELEKAVVLYRSIIPSSAWFELEARAGDSGGKRYRGFRSADGGLEIAFDDSLTAPLRKRHGSLLPKEIIRARAKERAADCLEYTFVLIALLRAAGIEAYFKEKPGHAYVVAVLDHKTYALDAANRTFKESRERGDPDRLGLAVHYSNEGVVRKEQGKLEEAIRCFDRAIALRPDHAQAFVNKGLALRERGDLEQAVQDYDRALSINPRDARAWSNKGVALGQQGKLEQALMCYDRALLFKPDYHKPWNNKGIVFFRRGDVDEAVRCYDKALAIKPDYVKAWYNKGLALRVQGDPDGAIACFEKALEIQPDKAVAWYSKGVTLQQQGKPRQAKQCFNRAEALGLSP